MLQMDKKGKKYNNIISNLFFQKNTFHGNPRISYLDIQTDIIKIFFSHHLNPIYYINSIVI